VSVAYSTFPSPIGDLTAAVTGRGLVRVGLPVDDPVELVDDLERRLGERPVESGRDVAPARAQLDEYFAGERQAFTMPLDWSLARGFRLRVLEEMFQIPYGQTVTYAELAGRAGNPRAPRAAGQACATNPIPIVLPCHRVLSSDGGLNWYSGGLHFKEFLLRHEGALLV
jgi:methylated-DNA-[protein]-cysteine S-methyltransferase